MLTRLHRSDGTGVPGSLLLSAVLGWLSAVLSCIPWVSLIAYLMQDLNKLVIFYLWVMRSTFTEECTTTA